MHAEEKYSRSFPYLKTKIFNVELPPGDQGLTGGAYDIVIAANVLHATRNIRNTLRNT